MLIWSVARNFSWFVLSRVVGGLTEGNVQMSIAMISDVTDESSRSQGMVNLLLLLILPFTRIRIHLLCYA